MHALIGLGILTLCSLAAAGPQERSDTPAHGFRRGIPELPCSGRGCGDTRDKPAVNDMQARQANAKAEVERQVSELHSRLRAEQQAFLQSRSKFDLLGVRLGDSQPRVASVLAKEFPEVRNEKAGIASASNCVLRSSAAQRNGDCIGREVRPSGDPKAINPQTRILSVEMTDKGRVHGLHYKQTNLFVATTLEGCERERDAFLAGVAAKYGQPFSRSKQTITWGAALPKDAFDRAYSNGSYGMMGEKSLDGDKGLLNNAQRVLYFQGAYSMTAQCLGRNGESISMTIDAFLADSRIEEEDSSAVTSKPKL